MGVTKTTTTKQMNSEMNANNATTLHPTTWEELRTIIEYELERQGQDADLNHIDVSGVTDMSDLFRELDIRHIKIDKWDVSNVTDMSRMFEGAYFFNADLSSWDVSNVQNMKRMFYSARSFNCDISNWNVSSVTDMSYMFYDARSFNCGLSKWALSSILHAEYITGMFTGATSFKGDPSVWNVLEIIQWATLELSRRKVANVALTD